MNRKEAHEKWGNQYKDNYNKMVKYMGINLQVRLDCTVCGIFKAREKGFAKVSHRKATKSVGSVCIETTGPCPANTGGTGYLM